MYKIQKATVISIVLFLTLIILFVGIKLNIQYASIAKGASESKTDFTQLTKEEQTIVENKIEEDWEVPHPSELVELQDGATTITGSKWYYLTKDISVNISTKVTEAVRIVLNGYSISGTFEIKAEQYSYSNKIFIFDRIPNMIGTGYEYNPTPERYYSYNSQTQGYTSYSNTQPSGIDVTDMPTWQENTYIKVVGSAISPNSRNSSCATFLYAYALATLNIYNINIVGIINTKNSIIVGNGYANINLYQCNILGNKAQGSKWGGAIWSNLAVWQDSKIFLKACKVYGNQIMRDNFGIEISNQNTPKKLADISVGYQSYVTLEKSNVGAIWDHSNLYTENKKAVWLKDVDFKQTIRDFNLDNTNFETKIQNMDNITGTIELIYNINLTYTGNSPNLNFIVYGGDSNTAPKKGFNHLNLGEGATVGNVTTAFSDTTISDITVNGTVSGLSTPGNVTISESGNLTIQTEQSIRGNTRNSGVLHILGAVDNLTTYDGTTSILGNANIAAIAMLGGETQLKTSTAILPSDLVVQEGAIFTIFEDAYTTSNLINNGIVNIGGAIIHVQNETTGVVSVNNGAKVESIISKGEIRVNSGGYIENLIIDEGYSIVQNKGNVKNTVLNNGTLVIARKANVDSVLQFEKGTLIDHRIQFNHSIFVISPIIGGIVLLCIILILIVVIKRKKSKSKKKNMNQN